MTRFDAIVGGTFDVVHDGHVALLNEAFEKGDVLVGVTTQAKAQERRDREVTPHEERVQNVRETLQTLANVHGSWYEIRPIESGDDHAIRVDADYIVLSPESKTHERAQQINEKRIERDRDRLQIVEAPMVRDDKGRKISSTNVVSGEIDRHGNVDTDTDRKI